MLWGTEEGKRSLTYLGDFLDFFFFLQGLDDINRNMKVKMIARYGEVGTFDNTRYVFAEGVVG